MMNHLTAIEVGILLDKDDRNNHQDLLSHLNSCEECKKLLDDQMEIHKLLLTLEPQQAPLHLKEAIYQKVITAGTNGQLKWLIGFGIAVVLVVVSLVLFGLINMQPVKPAAQTVETGSYVKNGVQSMYNYIALGSAWLLNYIEIVLKDMIKSLNNSLLLLSIFLLGLIFYAWDWIYQIRISKSWHKK